jgi:heme/copper-type cytochrome/quinol oxidase subunit 3
VAIKTPTLVDPFEGSRQRFAAGVLGMWLFLAAVVMLFMGAIMGYLVVRLHPDPQTPFVPPGATGMPPVLTLSTLALLASSATMHRGTRMVKLGKRAQSHAALGWTMVLASAFLALQTTGWVALWQQQARRGETLYAWSFYVLTGLHALHVVGGFVPLVRVWRKSARGAYAPQHPEGVVYCEMYWHLLGALWLVIYGTLWLGMRP